MLQIDSSFNTKFIASHDAGLSTLSFSHDEWEVRIGLLDSAVVVEHVGANALRVSILLAHDESEFSNTLAEQRHLDFV